MHANIVLAAWHLIFVGCFRIAQLPDDRRSGDTFPAKVDPYRIVFTTYGTQRNSASCAVDFFVTG